MRGVMWLLLLSWSSLSLATSLLGGRAGQQIHPNRHRHHHHDIYIAGFFPTSPGHPGSAVGQGVMPAVSLALHDVNRSPDILPNHHLRMHWNNTAVSQITLCIVSHHNSVRSDININGLLASTPCGAKLG